MGRRILVAGNASAVFAAVETEVAARAETYAVAFIPNRFSLGVQNAWQNAIPGNAASGKRLQLEWNPGSPVSARTLLLAGENRLGSIDEVIFVCCPPALPCAVCDLKPADIEVLAGDHVKSWIFLARELDLYFKTKGAGRRSLALVYQETGNAQDIPNSVALASFRSLTAALLADAPAHENGYTVQGFYSGETGKESAFAAFVFKHLDDEKRRRNGKLHRHGKFVFFK